MTVKEFTDLLANVGDPDSEIFFKVKGSKTIREYVERETAGTFEISVDIDDDADLDDVASGYGGDAVEVTLWI